VYEEVDEGGVNVWLMISPYASTSTGGPRFQRNEDGEWVGFNRTWYSYPNLSGSDRYNMGSASATDFWPGQTSNEGYSTAYHELLTPGMWVGFGPWYTRAYYPFGSGSDSYPGQSVGPASGSPLSGSWATHYNNGTLTFTVNTADTNKLPTDVRVVFGT
jgi:hypothetical protein